MNRKDFTLLLLFVIFGVLFALSSCSEAGSETPKLPLDEHTLTYAPINGVENREITAVSPKWEPQLATAVSYTSADLPEGLTLDAQTGVITGKIPSVINAQTFTITATATGTYSGVVTATVSITITSSNLNANSFSYPAIAITVDTDILEAEGYAPTWTNTLAAPGDVTYSISGDSLPDGLSINENGVIWGNPTTPVAKKTYTISATAKDGGVYSGNTTGTVSIIIDSIILSEHSLSYPPIAVAVNIDIPEAEGFAPIWTDELAFPNDVRYTSTNLPEGLVLNADTGVISGRPTSPAAAQDYTITATAKDATSVYAGEVSGTVNIIVLHSLNLANYGFKYDQTEISASVGSTVEISPEWTTTLELPDAVSYSIENADGSTPLSLPTGLTFAETTGVISGTPTGEAPKRDYRITVEPKDGAAYTGNATFDISITIVAANDISGYTLRYATENKIEGVAGSPLSVTPSWDTTFTPATDISYEIDKASPPLPDGLTFAKTTGVISGTPKTAPKQTYDITASGTGNYSGEKTVSVSITIFAANDIGGPDYSLSYPELTTTPVGKDVTIAATWTGLLDTATVSYTVSPNLPTGQLSLNTQTGAITGTPNTVFSETYTVTATAPPSSSHIGTLTTNEFTITISPIALADKGRSFRYDNISIEVNKQIEGTGFLPTWVPVLDYPDAVSYSIEPPLATATTGLSFNPQTGAITGKPTTAKDATDYRVTAKGSGNHSGELGAQFNITITAIDISTNSLSYTNITGAVGTPITEVRPTWGKPLDYPDAVSYSIKPPLATATTGLSFNTDTGAITGKPTAALAQTTYTVTATGTGNQTGELDSTQFTIILRMDISDAPPTLSYPPITAEVGVPITAVPPVWGPELNLPTQVSYKITEGADPLPAGLSLVPATGVIRGTPTGAVAAAKDYRITVTGSEPYTGTRDVTVNITITMNISSSALTLSYPDITVVVNEPITTVYAPHWEPALANPVRYIVTGGTPLPTGLELVPATGVIRGTPTGNVAPEKKYSITVIGSGLYTSTREVQVSITITNIVQTDISDYSFTYPLATGPLGNISAAPVWADGTPEDLTVTYRVESIPKSPEDTPIQGLPTGLSLDTNTGGIAGSFANLAHVTAYKVIASGTGTYKGSTEAVFLDTLVLPTAYEQTTTGSTAISTRDDLERRIAGGTYHLTNHIDLGDAPWTPIPTFTGTLHGNGYAIYNLNIGGGTAHYQGLFAALGNDTTAATVENLGIGVGTITGGAAIGALAGSAIGSTIDNITSAAMNIPASGSATITSSGAVSIANFSGAYTGGLLGYLGAGSTLTGNSIGVIVSAKFSILGGLVGRNDGTVSGYATGAVSGDAYVGGLVGYNDGTVSGYATGAVSGEGYLGGLAGQNYGTVTGYANGTVTSTGNNSVGGLVGENYGTVSGYATGAVSGEGYLGGLVGYNRGTVSGYATGSVEGNTYIGGLVGANDLVEANDGSVVSGYATGTVSGKGRNVGGLVGWNQAGTVTGYATGSVTSTSNDNVGGLVGRNNTGTVTGYATGAAKGTYNLGGLVGNTRGGPVTGYATGTVTSTNDSSSDVGGLVGLSQGAVSGYWDRASTKYTTSVGTQYGTFAGAGISATRNIVYADPSYTDGIDGPPIFVSSEGNDVSSFLNAFDLPATSATWPKLKPEFSVGENSVDFAITYTLNEVATKIPLVQPTVSDTDGQTDTEGNYTIEVVMPTQEKFPEGWPFLN